MLREATLASNDDARLDHDIETVPDDANLGAELDGAPPEVRAAAVRRSRRIPEPSTMRAAWLSLPLAVRDQIGVAALTHSFYSETLANARLELTLKKAKRCEEWSNEALNRVDAVAMAALSGLYGTPEAEPLWALRDSAAVVYPAETHPSPLTLAIADHLRTEEELAAALVLDNEDPVRIARAVAEEDAYSAVIAAPLQDRADLVAFYEHFAPEAGDPGEEVLARALDALALALQLGRSPESAIGEPTPMLRAIAGHRLALDELRANSPYKGDNPDDAWLALADAEDETFEALLKAPCRSPADAAALVAVFRRGIRTPFLG